ncbi:hypothetical protein lerEdw1_019028 [Lerista edwardsae]|nr:hypothetical protein lerEdw1_019028 [Lerista edwardsae]
MSLSNTFYSKIGAPSHVTFVRVRYGDVGQCRLFCPLADVNECEVYKPEGTSRLCLHGCINTPGSYRCSCPGGYRLFSDGKSCEGDIRLYNDYYTGGKGHSAEAK